MVLHGRLCGRVDNRRLFFCFCDWLAHLLRQLRYSCGGNVRVYVPTHIRACFLVSASSQAQKSIFASYWYPSTKARRAMLRVATAMLWERPGNAMGNRHATTKWTPVGISNKHHKNMFFVIFYTEWLVSVLFFLVLYIRMEWKSTNVWLRPLSFHSPFFSISLRKIGAGAYDLIIGDMIWIIVFLCIVDWNVWFVNYNYQNVTHVSPVSMLA